MKKLFTTILAILPFLFFAQAPQGINYQGLARDANGILSNKPIGVKFEIHQTTAIGLVVFSETHAVTTNAFGLFNVAIGSNSTSSFINIPWANGPFFIETLIDPTGGTAYVSLGTQQLMSVPYALYAEKAGNAVPTFSINTPHSVITNSVTNTHTIAIATPSLPTYGLTQSSGSINLTQNGTTISTVPVTTTSTTILTASTNILISGAAPNYTISSPSQSLSISGNTLSISSGNSVNIPAPILTYTAGVTSSTLQSGNPANSIVIPNYQLTNTTNTIILSNGVSTSSVVIPSPPISYTNNILSVGSSTANIPALWTESVTVLSPINLSTNISIGTYSNAGGKFEIDHNASASAPSIHLKQPTNGLNRIKLSNNSIPSKFFEIAGGTNSNSSLEAVTINYFNSSSSPTYRTVFQLDGNKQIGINPLEFIKGSLHVMEDNTNTPTNGIISEGFNKAGQLILGSNSPTGTYPAYTRGALPANSEMGKILFSGATSATSFSDGAKIYAKSVTAFNALNSGADLFFATTLNNNISAIDRMVILNNGNVGIGTNSPTQKLDILGSIKIKDGSEAVGYVLTSDASGKGTWMPPTMVNSSPWTKSGAIVTLSTTTDNVGIGTNTPTSKLEVVSSGISTILADNSGSGVTFMADKSAGTGIVAYIRNASSTNSSDAVKIENFGTGTSINASNNSSNATIFAKNNNFNGIAGDFDGGIKSNNSGSLASINAFKSSSSTGNVAVFTNSAPTNAGDVVQISNIGSANGHGIWVNTGSLTKAAGYFSNTGVGVEVASGKEGVKVSSTSNIAAITTTMNGTGAAIEAVSGPSSKNAIILNNGHIKVIQSTTVTISSSSGKFTIGATGATDIAGSVETFTPTPIPAITGTAETITITYAKPYVGIPPTVIITPLSEEFAKLNYWVVSSLSGFTIYFKSTSGSLYFSSNNIEEAFSYHVIGN